jgi:hypothetical protein
MSIDKLRSHYGLSATPFSRGIAPSQIFAARTHKEAVARLKWLIDETAIGVVTGEVGAGKTLAARACVSNLDASRFTIVYLSNPMVGARGIHHHLVTALGDIPKFHRPALIAQTADLRCHHRGHRRLTAHPMHPRHGGGAPLPAPRSHPQPNCRRHPHQTWRLTAVTTGDSTDLGGRVRGETQARKPTASKRPTIPRPTMPCNG